MSPRAGLDDVEKRKFFTLAGLELRPLCPARSESLFRLPWSAHITHNTIQTATDVIPVDIQGILLKVHFHFYLHTIRVIYFKEFCGFLNQECKKFLGYSNTRWLALLLAVERLLNMFLPVISFFGSLEKCPCVFKAFFLDPLS
jgi:hypothetical protein